MEGAQLRQSVNLVTGIVLVAGIVAAGWLALQQREPGSGTGGRVEIRNPASDTPVTSESALETPSDARYPHASPVAGKRDESAHDLQASRIDRIVSNQGNLVRSDESLAIGQGEANSNELERGPGESYPTLAAIVEPLDHSGPGEGPDDVGASGPGPGEGPQYDDQRDAGPGASDVDIAGPGLGEADPGIDELGPGDADPGIDEPGPGESDPIR